MIPFADAGDIPPGFRELDVDFFEVAVVHAVDGFEDAGWQWWVKGNLLVLQATERDGENHSIAFVLAGLALLDVGN